MGKTKAWAKVVEIAPLGVVITATLGCVALGVLFGWILFGRPHLITNTEKIGTVAEWVAAAGTWVVGYMAWRISQQSLNHNLQLTQQSNHREKREETACLRRLHFEVRRMYAGAGAVLAVLRDDAYSGEGNYLALSVEIGNDIVGVIDWPTDAIPLLEENDVEALHKLQSTHIKWRVYCGTFISSFKNKSAGQDLDEEDKALLRFQIERTEELSTMAKTFRIRLEDLLD